MNNPSWTVAIRGLKTFCGGVILNENTILTAAHCVDRENIRDLKVFAGETNLEKFKKFTKVLQIFIHPNYDKENLYHDLAIIKLVQKLEFNQFVRPIMLSTRSPKNGENAYFCGWGSDIKGTLSQYMRVLDVKITSSQQCKLKYGEDYNQNVQICAGNLYYDFCLGDSGGPLVQYVDGRWYVIGIISYTGEMCSDGKPSVYSDVFRYYSWISSLM